MLLPLDLLLDFLKFVGVLLALGFEHSNLLKEFIFQTILDFEKLLLVLLIALKIPIAPRLGSNRLDRLELIGSDQARSMFGWGGMVTRYLRSL